MEEIWKDIEGYVGVYQVSNCGRIKSLSRIVNCCLLNSGTKRTKEKILKPQSDKDGYELVTLYKNCIPKIFKVHRIVADSFIPNPNGFEQINHKNGIKNSNFVENLEWCNASQNALHAYRIGLRRPINGEEIHTSKLTAKQVLEIRKLFRDKVYNKAQLSKMYNMAESSISHIINRKNWKHI